MTTKITKEKPLFFTRKAAWDIWPWHRSIGIGFVIPEVTRLTNNVGLTLNPTVYGEIRPDIAHIWPDIMSIYGRMFVVTLL